MLSRKFNKSTLQSVRRFSVSLEGQNGVKTTVNNKLLINGEWVDSASGKYFDVFNPAEDEVFTQVASAGAEDVDRATQAARAALHGPWSQVKTFERAAMMNKLADKLQEHGAEIATLESMDNGKPFFWAMMDVHFVCNILRYYAGACQRINGEAFDGTHNPNLQVTTRYEPMVAGCITPWNYPLQMFVFKLAPLLASGSTGVFKPAEVTPLSALKVAELWESICDVPGVINVIPGLGAEAGQAIVDHPGINKIAFTGSTAVGQQIMRGSADNMKRITLELGGKSPLMIMDDADLDKAIECASTWSFMNAGQVCVLPSRYIVQEGVYDKFVEALTERAKGISVGAWYEENVFMGPLVSQQQLDKVQGFVAEGKKEAKLTFGGDLIDRKGYFMQPTVFADTNMDMSITRDEIFGPVVTISKFKTFEEGIAMANNTKYGLNSGIYTTNMHTANRFTKEIQAGQAWVNTYFSLCERTPFGGYKMSGLGRELGNDGLYNFLEKKTVGFDMSP